MFRPITLSGPPVSPEPQSPRTQDTDETRCNTVKRGGPWGLDIPPPNRVDVLPRCYLEGFGGKIHFAKLLIFQVGRRGLEPRTR